MELDAFQRKGQVSKEEMDHQRKEKLCFQCGKPGHLANFHSKERKGNQQKGKRPMQRIHTAERKAQQQIRVNWEMNMLTEVNTVTEEIKELLNIPELEDST